MVSSRKWLTGSDRYVLSWWNGEEMIKKVKETHLSDDQDFDVNPILRGAHQILHHANPSLEAPQAGTQIAEDMTDYADLVDRFEGLVSSIHRIVHEISYNCFDCYEGDAHSMTLTLLTKLKRYSWGAKAAIALAAFSVSYGKFKLMRHLSTKNPLVKSLGNLEMLPDIIDHYDALMDNLGQLIKGILSVTRGIAELNELPYEDVKDATAMEEDLDDIPTAVYWTIRSVVTCTSHFTGLTGTGRLYLTTKQEVHELRSLNGTVSAIETHLREKLAKCYQHIEEKKFAEMKSLFDSPKPGMLTIFQALIDSKDDMPICEGGSRKRVSLEVLKSKTTTLLLISNLDASVEELTRLTEIYKLCRDTKRLFEMLWIPVIDRSEKHADLTTHTSLSASSMPWYYVFDPLSIKPGAIRYIKEKWNFNGATILVTLDVHGKVVHHDALHMAWIWGSLAYPFTLHWEEKLWRKERWKLEFVVDDADRMLHKGDRINMGKGIFCLYGGENMIWITRFTSSMANVAPQLKMIYAGSQKRKDLEKITTTITKNKISDCWGEERIRLFWVRLYRLWRSILHHMDHPIFQEVMAMGNTCADNEGWAVITSGSSRKLVKSRGEKMVECLSKLHPGMKKKSPEDFISSLEKELASVEGKQHSDLVIPFSPHWKEPDNSILCMTCRNPMEKKYLIQCREEESARNVVRH